MPTIEELITPVERARMAECRRQAAWDDFRRAAAGCAQVVAAFGESARNAVMAMTAVAARVTIELQATKAAPPPGGVDSMDKCELCQGTEDVQAVESGSPSHIGMNLCAGCRRE